MKKVHLHILSNLKIKLLLFTVFFIITLFNTGEYQTIEALVKFVCTSCVGIG